MDSIKRCLLGFIMEELLLKVDDWFISKNLHKVDPQGQMLKQFEEAGELAGGIAKDNLENIKEEIGDNLVVLRGVMLQMNAKPKQMDAQHQYLLHALISDESGYELYSRYIYSIVALNDMVVDRSVEAIEKQYKMPVFFLDLIADSYDLTLQECLQCAYDKIKGRKGLKVNDIWVKYDDLSDEQKEEVDNDRLH